MSLMRPIADIREQMDRIFHEMEDFQFPTLMPEIKPMTERGMRSWLPPVDLIDKNDHYELRMEIPGMKPEDIDVQVLENAVLVRGQRKEEKETEQKDAYRRECHYGTLYRRIPLPASVKSENASAELKHGILTLKLPKAAELHVKKIPVQSK